MADRQNFTVSSTLGVVVKHAWNSAVGETERAMRERAQATGKTYRLVAKASQYDERGFYLVSGTRSWQADDGETITFTITKG